MRRPSQHGRDVSIYLQHELSVPDLGSVQDKVDQLFLLERLEAGVDLAELRETGSATVAASTTS